MELLTSFREAVCFVPTARVPGPGEDRRLELARARQAGIRLAVVAGGLLDFGHDEQRLHVHLHVLHVGRIVRQSLSKAGVGVGFALGMVSSTQRDNGPG